MLTTSVFDPRLIPSYVAGLGALVLIAFTMRKLSQAGLECYRPQNRFLHQLKWAALAACCSVFLVKSVVRIWYIATGQGPTFVDVSWWKHLWIVIVLAGAVSACLAVYLRRVDRPFPPEHCKTCGYALTGNVSGVCPECGTETDCP